MKALILIDLQNDFMPGGALAVPNGHQVVPIANKLMPYFDVVVATQDFHPAQHQSFASQHPQKKIGETFKLNGIDQILWPDHCVQNQPGCELVKDLDLSQISCIFRKGSHPEVDSYSAFFDNGHLHSTELDLFLKNQKISEVFLAGLATDYCVKYSALDAQNLKFRTHVIIDACRAVELSIGDTQKAIEDMQKVGIQITSSDFIFSHHPIKRARDAAKSS